MDTTDKNTESWQVEFGGEVRDVSFQEMTAWISEGSLLRIDRVRKGDLRWIEAGKVPSLTEFFSAKDLGTSPPPTFTTSSGIRSNVEVLGPRSVIGCEGPRVSKGGTRALNDGKRAEISDGSRPPSLTVGPSQGDVCAVHPDIPAAVVCDTCSSAFCKACPNSYGSEVKICPFCGAMCSSVAKAEQKKVETQVWQHASTEKFGFADLATAFAYPFKYPASLIFGAVMFAFFSVGQGAASFGGAFMLAGAILCFMCANMLSFGILANVVENFAQGKIGGNFMPSFDDFNIWDDVVHPFFLMIGVYISSFGPLAACYIVSIFLFAGAVKPDASSIDPTLAAAPGQIQQGQNIKQLIAQQNAQEQSRIEQMTDPSKLAESEATDPTRRNAGSLPASGPNTQVGSTAPTASASNSQAGSLRSDVATNAIGEEQRASDLQDQIAQAQRSDLESAFGKTPETQISDRQAMISKVLSYGIVFLIIAGLCLLWGLFYLPAACCVAGYTRSFGATLNPTVGLDTIKRLGGDYAKLLFMGFVILMISAMMTFVLSGIFGAFALPGVGNLPANFLGSLFGFYLSVVFSVTLGLAIFKASDRLQLYKG
jgi:hypothetical protein